jgi:polysaccharide pyruvyl transferase WcaK-like protein
MRRHLLIVGFFGEGNLGDEAILTGLRRAIPPTVPLVITTGSAGLRTPSPTAVWGRHPFRPTGTSAVLSVRPDSRPTIDHGSLGIASHLIPRRGPEAFLRFLRALRTCRGVVFTGGLLQDWSWEGVTFYALRLLATRVAGVRAGLWGTGLGPLRRPHAERLARLALQHVDAAWLRDDAAVRLFHTLTGRTGHRGTDWSWLIPVPHRGDNDSGAARRADGSAGCSAGGNNDGHNAGTANRAWQGGCRGINLRPWIDPHWQEVAVAAVTAKPAPLVGLAARNEDSRLLHRLFAGIEVIQPRDFADLMSLGTTLHEAWAMRYHAVLALLRAGIPVAPLSYDDKVTTLAAAAGLDVTGNTPRAAAQGFLDREHDHRQRMVAAFSAWVAQDGGNR